MSRTKKIIYLIIGLIIFTFISIIIYKTNETIKVTKLDKMVKGTWQGDIVFPDWKGYIDDTLAMNNMYSFNGVKNQGKLYLNVSKKVKSYDLFINNVKVNTKKIKNGIYEVDYSKIAKNGQNTIQVGNIKPYNLKEAIFVKVPYPGVINGSLKEVGLSKEPFDLIDKIITSDIKNGFTSAELAVIKDGKLVYENAWGNTNSYNQDGTINRASKKVTNDTLYDLASNTKMYSVIYSIEYLIDQEKISLDDKVVDIIGEDFANDTIEIKYSSFEDYPGLDTIKDWKRNITVKNLLMHQAGFPDSGHYHNEYFDTINQTLSNDVKNILYVSGSNSESALKEGINKTPLIYKPEEKTLYSDIDYMLLGIIVEKITEKDLDTFLKDTFFEPMNLKHITYNPLKNGFNEDDCAATELNGNTRDGLIDFPGIRKQTIKCEVHDEESYYVMGGISGHAGLFSNATDLAKLAYVMLTGGYENNRFFSKNTRDLFISPQDSSTINYGIGWWREADDKRVWYFGTESPESTIGHQGWTGTLTMIDFDNNMVIVYLTNTINTPIVYASSLEDANDFAGRYYTSSTLGFVPQIIYMGLENNGNLKRSLDSLIKDMRIEKQKYIEELEKDGKKVDDNHPLKKAKNALF